MTNGNQSIFSVLDKLCLSTLVRVKHPSKQKILVMNNVLKSEIEQLLVPRAFAQEDATVSPYKK